MTEVYWIAGTDFRISEEGHTSYAERLSGHSLIQTILKEAAAQMDWVDQWLWMDETPEDLNIDGQVGFRNTLEQKPLLKWTGPVGSPHYLLHAMSRSILVGDCDLAVVAQMEQSAGSAALLASPKAVGRYNLLPRARILERWELGCTVKDLAPQVLERIEKAKRDPDAVRLILLPSQAEVPPEAFSEIFPDAGVFSSDTHGDTKILFRLNDLVRRMEEESLDNGLLVSWSGGGPAVISWIERV